MSLKPRYSLSLAFCLALLLHIVLLSRTWLASSDILAIAEKPLSVSLIKEPEKADLVPELLLDEVRQEVKERPIPESNPEIKIEEQQASKPDEELVPSAEVIINQSTSEETESNTEITQIQTSLNSRSFSRFIESETKAYVEKAPESVNRFDKTFAPQEYDQAIEELSPLSPKYTTPSRTDYAYEHNGKRTCVLRVVNALDIIEGDYFVYGDCSPDKKFELDLNKPRN